jgi:hypothetical protein
VIDEYEKTITTMTTENKELRTALETIECQEDHSEDDYSESDALEDAVRIAIEVLVKHLKVQQ